MVLPLTVGWFAWSRPAPTKRFATNVVPPAGYRSAAANFPPGFKISQERHLAIDPVEIVDVQLDAGFIARWQKMQHSIRRATGRGHRCDRILQRFARRRYWRGRRSRFKRSITILHALEGHVVLPFYPWAGRRWVPSGCRGNSNAIAIVLAVNWPPQAPGPGQAWSSRSPTRRSSSCLMHVSRLGTRPGSSRHGLETVPGHDRAAIQHQRRHVEACERQHRSRNGLSRPRAHNAVNQMASCYQLGSGRRSFTADQRGLAIPSVPIEMPSETAIVSYSIGVPPERGCPPSPGRTGDGGESCRA